MMRQRATWLVVLAVSALGIAAGVDALSGDEGSKGGPAAAPPTTRSTSTEAAGPAQETAAAGGFSGVLYYTDAGCRLRAVRLTVLDDAPAPPWRGCRFSLSPDGSKVAPAGAHWQANGELFPTAPGRPASSVTPGGRLTFMRGDNLVDARNGAVIVPEALLARALMTTPNIPEDRRLFRFRVEETAWLSETRVAAILSADVRFGPQDEEILAVFDDRRLVNVNWGGHISQLRTSPRGGFIAVRSSDRAGFLLFDANGDPVPAPPVTGYRAIAWSPDESWAALATRASIYVFRPGESELRLRRLPIVAHDLAWRGEAGPALPAATGLVPWLERAGVGGTLYVSDAGCRIRSLRMPAVVWRDAVGSPGPCRFSVAPSGRITEGFVVWQQQGNLGATCNVDTVDVVAADGSGRFIVDLACQPAWKPDGTLTVIREGSLLELPRRRRERVALSAERVQKALGPDARLEEAAWIDDDQVAAAVRRGTKAFLAVFHRGRLVARPVFSSPRIEGIEPNGRGLIAAQTGFGADRITFFGLDGQPLFSVPGGRMVSWSPRGGIAAVAVGRSVLFLDPLTREARRLPLFASDLQWR